MFQLKNKYYKVRIIVTFALISILLVIGMSRISYYFVKDLYLQQLEDQLNLISEFISEDFNEEFVTLLEVGRPSPSLENYFQQQVTKNPITDLESEVFIFNSSLNIMFSADNSLSVQKEYPELIFYQDDINLLSLHSSMVTIPFEGVDDKWYLYSFRRIGPDSFLGIKAPAVKFARIEEFGTLFWLLGLSGIITIIVISWFLANSITRPINKLVKFSREIGDNKLETVTPENMKGELAILTRALDNMRKNILRNQNERENILAQIAHEIRNPLGGIELLAGLIKEDSIQQNLSAEYPQRILDEVTGLKRLITSYLNYSKPSSPVSEDVDLNTVLKEIENILKVKLDSKHISLTKNITQPTMRFDRDHLKHSLMNLILNSVDSVPENGTIEIHSFLQNGSSVLSVKDNGPGIEKENMKRLFEPFFTTKKDGIGLGLAITKKYCEENNAEINVEPNNNNGVIFNIIKEV